MEIDDLTEERIESGYGENELANTFFVHKEQILKCARKSE